MGYGDYTPPSSGRAKPLSKKQIQKLQEAYKDADTITAHVQKEEAKEQEKIVSETEKLLNFISPF